MVLLRQAADAWKLLEGVFCIYKPPYLSLSDAVAEVKTKLCQDLNSLEVRPPRLLLSPLVERNSTTGELKPIDVSPVPVVDYSDHPLVVGERYQPVDLHIEPVNELATEASGVCALCINNEDLLCRLQEARQSSQYLIKGVLGKLTSDHMDGPNSKIYRQVGYDHVTRHLFDKWLMRTQSNYQKASFHYAGVHMQSQRAYEMAARGVVRPQGPSPALFTGVRMVYFKRPSFGIEVYVVNENSREVVLFVENLGVSLKTAAAARKIRRIREGCFTVEHGLLRKHWTLQHVLHSIPLCTDLTEELLNTVESENTHGVIVTADVSTLPRSLLETMQDDDGQMVDGQMTKNCEFGDTTANTDVDLEARLLMTDSVGGF